MSAEEYRQRAYECFLVAENVSDPGTKIWLLEMAQSWLVLAQQAEKNLDADLVQNPVHAAPRSHNEPVMQQQQQVQPKKDPKKDPETEPKKDPGAKNE
jgi:hypothetical protein